MAEHGAGTDDRPLGHHYPLGASHLEQQFLGARSLSVLDLSTFFPFGFPDVEDWPAEETRIEPSESSHHETSDVAVQRAVESDNEAQGSHLNAGTGGRGAIAGGATPFTSESVPVISTSTPTHSRPNHLNTSAIPSSDYPSTTMGKDNLSSSVESVSLGTNAADGAEPVARKLDLQEPQSNPSALPPLPSGAIPVSPQLTSPVEQVSRTTDQNQTPITPPSTSDVEPENTTSTPHQETRLTAAQANYTSEITSVPYSESNSTTIKTSNTIPESITPSPQESGLTTTETLYKKSENTNPILETSSLIDADSPILPDAQHLPDKSRQDSIQPNLLSSAPLDTHTNSIAASSTEEGISTFKASDPLGETQIFESAKTNQFSDFLPDAEQHFRNLSSDEMPSVTTSSSTATSTSSQVSQTKNEHVLNRSIDSLNTVNAPESTSSPLHTNAEQTQSIPIPFQQFPSLTPISPAETTTPIVDHEKTGSVESNLPSGHTVSAIKPNTAETDLHLLQPAPQPDASNQVTSADFASASVSQAKPASLPSSNAFSSSQGVTSSETVVPPHAEESFSSAWKKSEMAPTSESITSSIHESNTLDVARIVSPKLDQSLQVSGTNSVSADSSSSQISSPEAESTKNLEGGDTVTDTVEKMSAEMEKYFGQNSFRQSSFHPSSSDPSYQINPQVDNNTLVQPEEFTSSAPEQVARKIDLNQTSSDTIPLSGKFDRPEDTNFPIDKQQLPSTLESDSLTEKTLGKKQDNSLQPSPNPLSSSVSSDSYRDLDDAIADHQKPPVAESSSSSHIITNSSFSKGTDERDKNIASHLEELGRESNESNTIDSPSFASEQISKASHSEQLSPVQAAFPTLAIASNNEIAGAIEDTASPPEPGLSTPEQISRAVDPTELPTTPSDSLISNAALEPAPETLTHDTSDSSNVSLISYPPTPPAFEDKDFETTANLLYSSSPKELNQLEDEKGKIATQPIHSFADVPIASPTAEQVSRKTDPSQSPVNLISSSISESVALEQNELQSNLLSTSEDFSSKTLSSDVSQVKPSQPKVFQPNISHSDISQPEIPPPGISPPDISQADISQADILQADISPSWLTDKTSPPFPVPPNAFSDLSGTARDETPTPSPTREGEQTFPPHPPTPSHISGEGEQEHFRENQSPSPDLEKGFGVKAIDFHQSTTSQSDIAQSDIAQSDIAQSDIAQSDIARPDIAQPDIAQSIASQSDITQSDIDQLTASQSDIIQPDIDQLIASQSDIAQPDIAQLTASQSNIVQPDIAQSDIAQSIASQSDIAQLTASQSDIDQSGIAQSDIAQSKTPSFEVTQSKISEPKVSIPEIPPLEGFGSESFEPEISRAEDSAPEIFRSEVSSSEVLESDTSKQSDTSRKKDFPFEDPGTQAPKPNRLLGENSPSEESELKTLGSDDFIQEASPFESFKSEVSGSDPSATSVSPLKGSEFEASGTDIPTPEIFPFEGVNSEVLGSRTSEPEVLPLKGSQSGTSTPEIAESQSNSSQTDTLPIVEYGLSAGTKHISSPSEQIFRATDPNASSNLMSISESGDKVSLNGAGLTSDPPAAPGDRPSPPSSPSPEPPSDASVSENLLPGALQPIGILQSLTSETLVRKRSTEPALGEAIAPTIPTPSDIAPLAAPTPSPPSTNSDLPSQWSSLADLMFLDNPPPSPSSLPFLPMGQVPATQFPSPQPATQPTNQNITKAKAPNHSPNPPLRRRLSVSKRGQFSGGRSTHLQAQFASPTSLSTQPLTPTIQPATDSSFTTITANASSPTDTQALEQLAQEIYYLLRQRLAIEQERHGRIYPKRFS